MRRYLQALSLLTRLPVRVTWEPNLPWGRLAGWFPLAGAVLGLPLALLAGLWTCWSLSARAPFVGPVLLLAAWEGLSGGLHLDGWADCGDAFFTPVSRERRLEIMADPRIGSFGTLALVLLLLAKFAALHAVLATLPAPALGAASWLAFGRGLLPFLAIPALARWAAVLALADTRLPLARPTGMAARTRDGLGRREVAAATFTALLSAAALGWAGALLMLLAAATAVGLGTLARARIGGLSGDVLGATIEGAEALLLVVVALAG